jgi:hypothetical protein
MKRMKPGEAPFNTQNALLAYCLHLAGVPWENDKHPCMVIYSPEIVKKFTNGSGEPVYKGREWNFALVSEVHKSGWRGHVEFKFAYSPRTKHLLKAYKQQCEYLDAKDGFLHQLARDLASQFSEVEPDIALLRLACTILRSRPDFMELWTHQVPCLMVANEGEVNQYETTMDIKDERRQVRAIDHPGFKIVSVNAGKETLAHLGLEHLA